MGREYNVKHEFKRPSLVKEIEQLRSYKGLAAAGAKSRLAELEKKYADLVAQGKEAEAHVSPDPVLQFQKVEKKQQLNPAKAAEEQAKKEKPAPKRRSR
jgi:hypothetical protein